MRCLGRIQLTAAMLCLLGAAPVNACPRNAACLVAAPDLGKLDVDVAATTPTAGEDVSRSIDGVLRTRLASASSAIAMPWIWQVLRREVYRRMPRYEVVRRELRHDGSTTARQPELRRFSLVLSPVVVTGTHETTPGIGIAGDF